MRWESEPGLDILFSEAPDIPTGYHILHGLNAHLTRTHTFTVLLFFFFFFFSFPPCPLLWPWTLLLQRAETLSAVGALVKASTPFILSDLGVHQKQRLFNTAAGRFESWQRTDWLSVPVHTALYFSILPANILVFDVRRDWYYEVSRKGTKFPPRLSRAEIWLFSCTK